MKSLPYFTPDFVIPVNQPDYSVKEYLSDQGVSFTSLTSCVSNGAELTISWKNYSGQECCGSVPNTVPVDCLIPNFYDECFGRHLPFEIPEDHPVWTMLGSYGACFRDLIKFNSWKFKDMPSVKPAANKELYDISFTIIQQTSYTG